MRVVRFFLIGLGVFLVFICFGIFAFTLSRSGNNYACDEADKAFQELEASANNYKKAKAAGDEKLYEYESDFERKRNSLSMWQDTCASIRSSVKIVYLIIAFVGITGFIIFVIGLLVGRKKVIA